MNGLPFLKRRKLPRIAQTEPDRKLINASSEDLVDDQCSGELMDAVQNKDPRMFLSALDALVRNAFDWNKDHGRED